MNTAVGATAQRWVRGTNWTAHAPSKDLRMQLELKQAPAKQHQLKGQILPPHHPQFLLGPPGGAENNEKKMWEDMGEMGKWMK